MTQTLTNVSNDTNINKRIKWHKH